VEEGRTVYDNIKKFLVFMDVKAWLHVGAFGLALFLIVEAEKALLRYRNSTRGPALSLEGV
jgi:hypothetical protein